MGSLDGKVAVVTGSGRGIGRAIAVKLARAGARVVINDVDMQPAVEAEAEVREFGGEAICCNGDVTHADFGRRLVEAAVEGFGGLDIIVNNAGYTWDGVIQKMSDEQFQAMLDVHLIAPFRLLRAAFPYIRETARREAAESREVLRKVVNVSSIAGLTGNPGQVNYSAAKAAIVGVTRTLCKEWGRYKVNVNAIAYAMIDTRIVQPVTGEKPRVSIGDREVSIGIPAEQHKALAAMVPLGRLGTPEEAAGATYLLCVPESDYISGQVLVCGGGLYM
jgi:3-oxoacyl-[acyl-carrier protein] reductase